MKNNNYSNRSSQIPFDFDRYEEEISKNQKENLAKDLLQKILRDLSPNEYHALINAFSAPDPVQSFAEKLHIEPAIAQARIQHHLKKIAKSANPQIIEQILSR